MTSWRCQVGSEDLYKTDCQMRSEYKCLIFASAQAETRQLVAQTGGLDDLRAEVSKKLTVENRRNRKKKTRSLKGKKCQAY